jgi:integrase
MRFKRMKVVQKTRWFTQEEFSAILRELDPQTPIAGRSASRFVPGVDTKIHRERAEAHDMFIALCLMGGRWTEVATVTLRMVQETVATLYGWKTGRERAVPLAGLLKDVVDRRSAAAEPGQIYLFPGKLGIETARCGPSRAISRAITKAGCNAPHLVKMHGRATIHSTRHTFASWLLQGDASLADVQQLLGHASITMTMRYSHLDGKKVVDRAASILGGVRL